MTKYIVQHKRHSFHSDWNDWPTTPPSGLMLHQALEEANKLRLKYPTDDWRVFTYDTQFPIESSHKGI